MRARAPDTGITMLLPYAAHIRMATRHADDNTPHLRLFSSPPALPEKCERVSAYGLPCLDGTLDFRYAYYSRCAILRG